MDTETQLAFKGTQEQQELAARAFELMKRKGMLFAANAPIKMTLDSIAAALIKDGVPLASADANQLKSKLEAALKLNSAIFAPGADGEFITTKAGHAYHTEQAANEHTFRERLNTDAKELDAAAARDYASSLVNKAANRAERSAILETIVEMPSPLPPRPAYTQQPPLPRSADIPTLIPRSALIEEALPEVEAPPAQRTQEAPPAQPAPATRRTEEEAPAPRTRRAEPLPAEEQAAPRPVPPVPIAQEPVPAAHELTQAEQPVAVPAPPPVAQPKKPVPAAPPPAPAVTGPIEVRIATAEGPVTIDLRDSVEQILANRTVAEGLEDMIRMAAQTDTRLVSFGADIFPEEALERFSKGDFRRIKEYLDEPETGGVASDRDIMADVLNRRIEHPDYERLRFSLDYRMLKEKKDFEFVGIDSDRLWINAGVSPVPSPGRKPAELGQDYRHLEDPAIASVEAEHEAAPEPNGSVQYALTYYEYENGVLPYDLRFKRIFPGQIFEDQRSSLLRFEIPQLYGAVLAELRYPTGNRGGFIMGLNDLFTEHMVPGARFIITSTDRGEDVFELQFAQGDEREESLLHFDERRGRYIFRPIVFSIDTDPSMLLTQEKFGKLQNQKKLEDAERRRPEAVIINAFEVVGEQSDGKLWAIFDDLYPVVNLERPISPTWLETLLSGAYPYFYADETTQGAYFYDPLKRPA